MAWFNRPTKLRPKLAEGEEILAATQATAAGTGRIIAIAAAIGGLIGLLIATTGDSISWWSSTAFGSFTGIIVGYGWAWTAARQAGGPGAVSVIAVMTNQRLMVFRRSASIRSQPLRSLDLPEISRVVAKPAPVGAYQWVRFVAATESVALFANTVVDFAALHREQTAPQQVD